MKARNHQSLYEEALREQSQADLADIGANTVAAIRQMLLRGRSTLDASQLAELRAAVRRVQYGGDK
jgi:hypothetical protein